MRHRIDVMRFDDLRQGGRALVEPLARYRGMEGGLVLGLVRGGVPAALEVSTALDLPLDVVLFRSIFAREPCNPVRATTVGGRLILDPELTSWPDGAPSIEQIHANQAIEELRARTQLCRGQRAPLDIAGRTVLVVDNGIRTGTSMWGAVQAIRRSNPVRLIAAVPVADATRVDHIRSVVDELICLATPQPFGNAAVWYRNFDVPVDDTISTFLDEREHRVS
jgi:putative phosphoribosyl transferase